MFFEGKFLALLTYALFGMVMAVWPLFAKEKIASVKNSLLVDSRLDRIIPRCRVVVISIAITSVLFLVSGRVSWLFLIGFVLIALAVVYPTHKYNPEVFLTVFLALWVSALLPYWTRRAGNIDIDNTDLIIFGSVVILFTYLFSTVTRQKNSFPFCWLIAYGFCMSILSFSTGIFTDSNAFLILWHHWSAYVGPSELLLSGAVLFRDFPAQYGLGPTALIASFCGSDCWVGMYFITAIATLLFSLFIAAMAFHLSSDSWPVRAVIMILCMATCFFWTAYPPDVGMTTMTPSVSGLRFLPAVILVAYLFFIGSVESAKYKTFIAHLLWAVGALWSPESAFYVTFVWWPYYLFVRRGQDAVFGSRLKALSVGGLQLLSIAVGLIVAFSLAFRFVYKDGPTLFGFLVTVLSPPSPFPINFHGVIWYFLSVLLIGITTTLCLWHQEGDTLAFRRGLLLQLLNYGVFSYFLGRSHENNILNLTPFMLLILVQAICTAQNKIAARASLILAAALIGWLPTFGWQTWGHMLTTGKLFVFDSKLLRDSMTFSQRDLIAQKGQELLDTGSPLTDADKAIAFVRQRFNEPVTVLDSSLLLVRSSPPTVWGAVHGPANYSEMPRNQRLEFINLTAETLKRVGWLVVAKNYSSTNWLEDLDSAYDRTNIVDFDTYYAIRFSPKVVK
jgi:hypothetical protein